MRTPGSKRVIYDWISDAESGGPIGQEIMYNHISVHPYYAEEGAGEILSWRFQNYSYNLAAPSSVIEGVFGIRWTKNALTAYVNPP